jgi:hypothetical protein
MVAGVAAGWFFSRRRCRVETLWRSALLGGRLYGTLAGSQFTNTHLEVPPMSPPAPKELRVAGVVSLVLAAVVAAGWIFLGWWFYLLCLLGSAIGLLIGLLGVGINRRQGRGYGIALAGVLASAAVLGFFAYLRIAKGPLVD